MMPPLWTFHGLIAGLVPAFGRQKALPSPIICGITSVQLLVALSVLRHLRWAVLIGYLGVGLLSLRRASVAGLAKASATSLILWFD